MSENTWKHEDELNIRIYTDLIAEYGSDVRALNWGGRESQHLRFSVLAQVRRLNDTSLLDVGCGLGDFYEWLKHAHLNVDYTGTDITPNMVEIAQQKFPEARFEWGNVFDKKECEIESYDVVVASGIFTYRQTASLFFLKAMIERMFSLCREAVAFNSLSGWASEKDEGEFYADPIETLAVCRALTPWVVLRHDYHPRDFTVYMYKQPIHDRLY